MNFSKECDAFIRFNTVEAIVESSTLERVSKILPISSGSSIDWSDVLNSEEVESVSADSLVQSILSISNRAEIDLTKPCFAIQLNEAVPPLLTTINDWSNFSYELDFVDTIFVAEDYSWIVHWDFYKNLHALRA